MLILKVLDFLLNVFKSLTPKQKEQLVNSVVDLFKKSFSTMWESFNKVKKDDEHETTLKTTTQNLTPTELNTTRIEMYSALPISLSSSKKTAFADSVLELVKTNEFLTELDNRIKNVDTTHEALYVEQCSLLMKQLLTEMILAKKI